MSLSSDILAVARLLLIKAQIQSAEGCDLTEIATSALELCDRIKDALPRAEAFDIPALLDSYNYLYTIATGNPAPRRLTDLWRDRLFKAWTANPASIPESTIYSLLAPLGRRTDNTVPHNSDMLLAFLTMRQSWLETLPSSLSDGSPLSPREIYSRVALLFADPALPIEEKRRLFYHYDPETLLNAAIASPSSDSLTTNDYYAVRAALYSLPEEILSFEKRIELDNRLLTHLLTASDLFSTEEETIRLTLSYNTLLLDD